MPTLNGMDSAAAALRFWERKQEIVANNLANVSTDGYKSQRIFAQLLDGMRPDPVTSSDMSTGTLRQTGNAMDVAVDGPGFFVVSTPNGERYTRGGTLRINSPDSPATMSILEEATSFAVGPMMGVFNNLVLSCSVGIGAGRK